MIIEKVSAGEIVYDVYNMVHYQQLIIKYLDKNKSRQEISLILNIGYDYNSDELTKAFENFVSILDINS